VVGLLNRQPAESSAGSTETGPLPLAAVPAPAASSTSCTGLLAALPDSLPGPAGPLARRPLADPAPPGAAAWVAAPSPAVLRCGLDRPAELTPTSPLLQVNGVRWLTLPGVDGVDADTFVAVDRPVFVALTLPRGLGTGPVQAVSDAVRDALPACEPMQPRDPDGVRCLPR
jgi:Protein of unknown function (DUF3515)